MRTLFGRLAAVAVIAMLFSISVAVAAEGERPAAPKAPAIVEAEKPQQMTQQERMKMCNQQAAKKSLKGDERRAFMSSCLRRH